MALAFSYDQDYEPLGLYQGCCAAEKLTLPVKKFLERVVVNTFNPNIQETDRRTTDFQAILNTQGDTEKTLSPNWVLGIRVSLCPA